MYRKKKELIFQYLGAFIVSDCLGASGVEELGVDETRWNKARAASSSKSSYAVIQLIQERGKSASRSATIAPLVACSPAQLASRWAPFALLRFT